MIASRSAVGAQSSKEPAAHRSFIIGLPVDVPNERRFRNPEPKLPSSNAGLSHDPIRSPWHISKKLRPWPRDPHKGIAAVLGRQEHGVIALPEQLCTIDQMRLVQDGAIRADDHRRAMASKDLECMQHAGSKIRARLIVQCDPTACRQLREHAMLATRRTPNRYRTDS